MMPDPIRIVIADDHPMFREGLHHTLAKEKELEIVAEAADGEEALKLTEKFLPDLILLDITMPNRGGIEIAKIISAIFPVIHIVMLTASENADDLMKALKAGARGYVLKGESAKELINAIRTVAEGGTYISPELAGMLLVELSGISQPDPFNDLTARERQILELVSKGFTNREIGGEIHLAEKTVKHYMTNILQKLHVRSRVEAALIAQKNEL
jgi:DNA-binding NarL/FixJ family response regulator